MATSAEAKARWWFAATVLAAAAIGLAWMAFAMTRYTTYELRTREPVSGLIPGSPVEFHGVEVGKVRSVELLQPRLVRVLLDVRREVPVSSATVATITGRGLATRGFTGYVYVSLEDNDTSGRPLAAGPEGRHPLLATLPSQMVSLDTSISQLSENVKTMRDLLHSVLDPQSVASLKQSLASLEQVTKTLSSHNDRLGSILANAERASVQVQPLLQSSSAAVRTLQTEVLPQAQSAMVQLESLSTSSQQRLGVILQNTEQASARFAPLLQSSNDAVRSLQTQILPEAHRTLTHLDQLSTSMGDTAGRIRRNPSLLLRGAGPANLGPGEGP